MTIKHLVFERKNTPKNRPPHVQQIAKNSAKSKCCAPLQRVAPHGPVIRHTLQCVATPKCGAMCCGKNLADTIGWLGPQHRNTSFFNNKYKRTHTHVHAHMHVRIGGSYKRGVNLLRPRFPVGSMGALGGVL